MKLQRQVKNKHTPDAIYCEWLRRVGDISAWHCWTVWNYEMKGRVISKLENQEPFATKT